MAAAPIPPREHCCKYCGCTESNACILGLGLFGRPQTCSWIDSTKTVCNSPACIRAHHSARTAKKKPTLAHSR